MVTSPSPARRDTRGPASSPHGGKARPLFLGWGLAATLLAAVMLVVAPAGGADLAAGLAVPRGFYDYAVNAFGEFGLYKGGDLPSYVSLNGRVSGYGSYRDQIGLLVGSASVLVRLSVPDVVGGKLGLKPYVSVGPSFNYQYSWADLDDFGTISQHETSATTSVFVGVDFFSKSKLSLFLEARQTLPSDFTVEYVLFGVKYSGAVLQDTE